MDERTAVHIWTVGVLRRISVTSKRRGIGPGIRISRPAACGYWPRVIAGDSCCMELERIKSLGLEAHGIDLCLGNRDLPARPFVDRHIHTAHHRLAREFVQAGLSMVEHVPLPVDLAEAAVRVSARRRRDARLSVRPLLASAQVDQRTAVCEGSERAVRVSIGERAILRFKAEFAFRRVSSVYEHVLALNLAHGRPLEVAVYPFLAPRGDDVPVNFRAGLERTHGGGVEFSRRHAVAAEPHIPSPVDIRPSVVVDERREMKSEAIHLLRIGLGPIADLERAVGAAGLRHHSQPFACPDVEREQVIRLLAVLPRHNLRIGIPEELPSAGLQKRLSVRVIDRLEYDPVASPVIRILKRRRPQRVVVATVGIAQSVVRAVKIHAHLSGIVRILEYIRLAVRDVFP